MPPVRVNVAVLSIADSAARGTVPVENLVADRLTEAGHQIAAFETVRDHETPIRAQLTGWLADPDIDVVVIVGDGEHTGPALKPMVDQVLPGFADLLRMLAYQEIGASAMLSAAEAVRCGTTFVFVLPGSEGAVKAALDKLILPQLDPKTKPRNLIGSMPRLRDLVEHDATKVDVAKLGEERKESAVPTPIPVEKTASGAGVQPKLPAGRAEPVLKKKPAEPGRPRSRTGVNVIVRTVEDPTKPIEIQKLEEQLELSKDDDPTQATAPREPARPNVAPARPLDAGNLRTHAAAKPLPSIVRPKADDHAKVPTNPETLKIGDATKPLPLAQAIPPVEIKPRGSRPRVTTPVGAPEDLEKLPKVPPGAELDKAELDKAGAAGKAASDNEETAEVISLAARAPTPAHVARIPLKSVPVAVVVPPRASPPAPVVPAARVRQPTPPIPTSVVIPLKQKKPKPEEIETLDLEPDAEPVAEDAEAPTPHTAVTPPAGVPTSTVAAAIAASATATASNTAATPPLGVPTTVTAPATEAAAVAAAPVDDDPDVASSHLLEVPKAPRRKPTQPPPLSDLITNAPSSSLSELPRGEFVYPTKRRSKVPLVIALLVLSAAIGGGAMWFMGRDKKPADTVTQPAIALDATTTEPDAAEVATTEPDAAEEPEIEMTPPDAAQVATTDPRPTRPTRPTRPPTDRPPADRPPADRPPSTTVVPGDRPAPGDKPTGPVAEPGCEEVACVLEKYARPCCARFKPQGETFVPNVGNGDDLSRAQIKAGVDKMKPRVIACGDQFSAKGKGTVKLSIGVDSSGNVVNLNVTMTPDEALGECIAGALRKAKFAQTKNGGSFSYPFVF